jgi:hypothetical protein
LLVQGRISPPRVNWAIKVNQKGFSKRGKIPRQDLSDSWISILRSGLQHLNAGDVQK